MQSLMVFLSYIVLIINWLASNFSSLSYAYMSILLKFRCNIAFKKKARFLYYLTIISCKIETKALSLRLIKVKAAKIGF